MPTQAIFFDLYQTLLDVDFSQEKEGKKIGFEKIIVPFLLEKKINRTEASLMQLHYDNELKAFYADHNINLCQHNFATILSRTLSKYYGLVISEAELDDLIYEFRKISRGHLTLYPGAQEVLETLSKQYIIVVASHTQGVYTKRELEELNILQYFEHQIYSSDIGFKKRSDNFYQECLKIAKLKPHNCVMVGDNLYEDIYMSERNGIHTIWIMNPLTKDKNEANIEPEAKLPIESILDLPKIIKKVLK